MIQHAFWKYSKSIVYFALIMSTKMQQILVPEVCVKNSPCISPCGVLFSIRRHRARITACWIPLKGAVAGPPFWMPCNLLPSSLSTNNFGVINMSEVSGWRRCKLSSPTLDLWAWTPELSKGQLLTQLDELVLVTSTLCALGCTYIQEWYVNLRRKLIWQSPTMCTSITWCTVRKPRIPVTESWSPAATSADSKCCLIWDRKSVV